MVDVTAKQIFEITTFISSKVADEKFTMSLLLTVFVSIASEILFAINMEHAVYNLSIRIFMYTVFFVAVYCFFVKREKTKAIVHLSQQIKAIERLNKLKNGHPQHIKWKGKVATALGVIFGAKSDQLKEFKRIIYAPLNHPAPKEDWDYMYLSGLERAKALLESFIEEYETYKT